MIIPNRSSSILIFKIIRNNFDNFWKGQGLLQQVLMILQGVLMFLQRVLMPFTMRIDDFARPTDVFGSGC